MTVLLLLFFLCINVSEIAIIVNKKKKLLKQEYFFSFSLSCAFVMILSIYKELLIKDISS